MLREAGRALSGARKFGRFSANLLAMQRGAL
jgi:hypothetical protein